MSRTAAASDPEFDRFLKIRWPETHGDPVCPYCGYRGAYFISTRQKFKCKKRECRRQYSPTSGTSLSYHKLQFAELNRLLTTHAPNAWQLAQRLKHQGSTIREARSRLAAFGGLKFKPDILIDSRPDWLRQIESRVDALNLPSYIRRDVVQDLAVLAIENHEKTISRDDLIKVVRQNYRFHDLKYKTISLFTPVGDDDGQLIDFISDADAHQRLGWSE